MLSVTMELKKGTQIQAAVKNRESHPLLLPPPQVCVCPVLLLLQFNRDSRGEELSLHLDRFSNTPLKPSHNRDGSSGCWWTHTARRVGEGEREREKGTDYTEESNPAADLLTLTHHQPLFLKLRAFPCFNISGARLISDKL